MRKTQRRVLAAMLTLADDELKVSSTTSKIALQAGYKEHGGAITSALEFLEYHNKIVKEGDSKWRITI